MKTAIIYIEEIYGENLYNANKDKAFFSINEVEYLMKEFAKDTLKNFNEWKAHKTPDLVNLYIKEKRL